MISRSAVAGRWIRILIAIACIWAFSVWCFVIRPITKHQRAYARIAASVESLVHRRPANVSRNQWSFVIGWTMNGIGNCCSVEGFLNPGAASHERFANLPDRFEQRLREDVTLEDVDWLWDELEMISKYGKRYSDQWRPTTAERMKEAEAVPVGNSGPPVD